MCKKLGLFLAAMVAGFALIGLSYLIPLPTLGLVFFIIGVIVVVIFALAIIFAALMALFNRRSNSNMY